MGSDYIDILVSACEAHGYTEEESMIIGIMAGCEQSHEAFGTIEKGFLTAAKFVNESSSAIEAIKKMSDIILK